MKSLSLSRPFAIIMLGAPGSGKSFFATRFSDMFQAPLASFDYIRHTIFPEPRWSRAEDNLVADIFNNQIDELFKTRRTFIIDGHMCSRTARSEIETKARKSGYDCLVVWAQTDEQTALQRSTQRNPAKKDGDTHNAPLDEKSFRQRLNRLTPPVAGREDYVVISGKHTFASQAKIVLKKLVDRGERSSRSAIAAPVRPVTMPRIKRDHSIQIQ